MAAFLFNTTIPFYPGVNVYLNELIAFALIIPLSLVFAMFAAAMPRSGGDYVYVSRTLHPALGMMSSFNNTVWWFIYGGVPVGVLRPLRPRAVPAHRRRHVRLLDAHELGQHARRQDGHRRSPARS